MLLSGADTLVRTLIEQQVEVVFGYPGGQILNVYDSLYKSRDEIRHVLTAHEQGATHAAAGYARASGRVGVVLATSGPGATNLVTGIATAYLDSVPLVAITGNVFSSLLGSDGFQEIDITGITLPITKHNYVVTSVESLAETVREAMRIAKSGRPGPVLIDVPKDIQLAMADYEPVAPVVADAFPCPSEEELQAAAEIINGSERPYLYFGGGMIASGAQEELLALAEKIDAPIGCSFMGLSAIPTDTERFLGMQGMHGHYASSMAMHKADCIVALGARFNDRVTGNKAKFAKGARIVHVDVDGGELTKNVPVARGLRGDLKEILGKLLPLVHRSEKPSWRETVAGLRLHERETLDNREGLTPRAAILALNRYLGENTPVATDVGQHQMWTGQNAVFRRTRRFISSGGPIGVVEEGDRIRVDIPGNKLELLVDEAVLRDRLARFVPKTKELSGYLKRYARLVSSGATGAILNS